MWCSECNKVLAALGMLAERHITGCATYTGLCGRPHNTRKLAVEVGHDLSQDMERYRAFYKQAYNADVSEADLVREMARRFMEADREF